MGKKKDSINKAKFSEAQLKGWEDYRSSIYEQQTKSHDSFEKAMTFITSGALGLTLAFHDKIVPVENIQYVIFIAVGWTFLSATSFVNLVSTFVPAVPYIVNLVSHYKSSKSLNKCADEIDKVISYKITFEEYNLRLEKRNKVIDLLNKITIWLLAIGLISVITYVIININNG